ncbi:uncharacterized protein LOC103313296 [Tribolium castaneum]|uniref:Uncharacterized protein n=1 Tax=Tribolium castaneum TaxID=7070 RepID=D2A4I6_TRICA|nr:PREDICTED: uncharacterized protein LOC103313296 isoform X2 [Tribolium castaneum]XP_015836225.1 PREDICTED: uncharacterized protein LOC103313296 isoform X2 [Tribolium castaneum]EFA05216.2 hypothetical protein TcasGA2_TC015356 [Tribolium castaneum]|eukprot:XP_008194459.1 PREDICTED: uncharacterized protein LOC103313296 isoform X2 [Tribolium castaneum]
MPPIASLLLLLTISQVDLTSTQDLKTIFRTPNKRNYDEFEILERSNFVSENSESKNYPNEKPKSYANAQILLRIGGDKEGCACGNNCKCCGGRNYPFYPLCLCLPPCYPYLPPLYAQPMKDVPPLLPPPVKAELPPPPKLAENELNENVVDEIEENVRNEHPVILDTIKIPDDAIKPVDDIEKCLKDVSSKIDPKQVSPNVKFVSLDLSQVPTKNPDNDKRDLQESLIPYLGSGQIRPKLLVTHPIFNRPLSESVGYKFSEGSWYYSDPVKSVAYQKPPILTVLGPQQVVKYLVVPVTEPEVVPRSHDEDCCCCSCAKYVGELNEKMA